MDNENRKISGEQPSLQPHRSLGRPPPGLERNPGFIPSQFNQNTTTSSPPPGLGPPYGFSPSNNNVFFQPPNGEYSFYSPPLTPLFPIDKGFQGTYEIPNGKHYMCNQPSSTTFYSGNTYTSIDSGTRKNDSPVKDPATAVIEPMIENLVGSMGISNGTYSHFGPPATSIVTGLSSFGQNHDNGNSVRKNSSPLTTTSNGDLIVNNDPFNSSPEWEFQRKMEAKIRQKQLIQKQLQVSNSVPLNTNSSTGNVNVKQNGENNKNITGHVYQSSSPPGSATPSPKPVDTIPNPRPQTPSKPSYLEILTKNCPKESSTSLKDTMKTNGEACPLFQVQNQSHRKSLDNFIGFGSSSSTASNPSTASSSPISRPRAQQKGKENIGSGSNSSTSSKTSTRRNTPVTTPVHQNDQNKKANGSTTCWIKKLSGRGNGKSNGKTIGNGNAVNYVKGASQFEFEIEDVDVSESITDSRGNNNDDKNSGKKKDKRRISANGTSASDYGVGNHFNATNSVDRRGGIGNENKAGYTNPSSSNLYFGNKKGSAGKEKSEKFRNRKEERNCAIRHLQVASKQWIAHLMKALTWLWTLLANVTVLSLSLTYNLAEDLLMWWKLTALPTVQIKMKLMKQKVDSAWKRLMNAVKLKKDPPLSSSSKPETYDEVLSVLGPERNIVLPATGEEALRRLLSVRGQDPYNILGVRSDSSEETIRRYYKKQAVLVHPDKNLVPGAEEAFKILAKAFELVGEPGSRLNYTQQLLEAHAKERFMGEFGELFEELRKKMETACSTIRCTKCKVRHKKNKTTRPLFAARYCDQCRIHHAAREGELWAEKSGIFSLSWQFYACMGNHIWEINEWGRCQRSSLKHLKPNSHNVIYRLVSGGQQSGKSGSGNNSNSSSPPNQEDELFDPEMDDWDSLINNLYRNPGNATNSSHNTAHKGSSSSKSGTTGNGPGNQNGNGFNSSTNSVSAKKRKGKRK